MAGRRIALLGGNQWRPGAGVLADKVAVVTGAGRGIGAAIAAKLAELGAVAVLTCQNAGNIASHSEKYCQSRRPR